MADLDRSALITVVLVCLVAEGAGIWVVSATGPEQLQQRAIQDARNEALPGSSLNAEGVRWRTTASNIQTTPRLAQLGEAEAAPSSENTGSAALSGGVTDERVWDDPLYWYSESPFRAFYSDDRDPYFDDPDAGPARENATTLGLAKSGDMRFFSTSPQYTINGRTLDDHRMYEALQITPGFDNTLLLRGSTTGDLNALLDGSGAVKNVYAEIVSVENGAVSALMRGGEGGRKKVHLVSSDAELLTYGDYTVDMEAYRNNNDIGCSRAQYNGEDTDGDDKKEYDTAVATCTSASLTGQASTYEIRDAQDTWNQTATGYGSFSNGVFTLAPGESNLNSYDDWVEIVFEYTATARIRVDTTVYAWERPDGRNEHRKPPSNLDARGWSVSTEYSRTENRSVTQQDMERFHVTSNEQTRVTQQVINVSENRKHLILNFDMPAQNADRVNAVQYRDMRMITQVRLGEYDVIRPGWGTVSTRAYSHGIRINQSGDLSPAYNIGYIPEMHVVYPQAIPTFATSNTTQAGPTRVREYERRPIAPERFNPELGPTNVQFQAEEYQPMAYDRMLVTNARTPATSAMDIHNEEIDIADTEVIPYVKTNISITHLGGDSVRVSIKNDKDTGPVGARELRVYGAERSVVTTNSNGDVFLNRDGNFIRVTHPRTQWQSVGDRFFAQAFASRAFLVDNRILEYAIEFVQRVLVLLPLLLLYVLYGGGDGE